MAGTVTGIIAGANPLEFSSSSPYTLFFFQAIIIIVFAQVIFLPLSWIKQPRVIAEVITGIILGPTVMGHIPNFTETVFPTDSIAGLTLTANVGVCLLLFMVGCEVDIQFIKKNFKIALSVGIFNMAVPFGLGCAISVGLWEEYRKHDESLSEIKFTTFMVFIAVAMCITAFPVLARILTELRLVKDRVGVIVLAAGITNDLLGWILLALSITLANATKSETTAYICLVTIGWCLFIVYPIRWVVHYVLKTRLKDIDNPNGPSQVGTMIILTIMFCSAFFTDIIGVHPIFGAFIVGTIVPRENNYVITLTERIEDLVNIIFVPLYFALAGLSVDLGSLNKGIDWAYTVGIIAVALTGKIFGGFVAAKFHGLYWREALTVGILMSCKGIVEIVVLNTGLKAGIISQKTFSMFILMALIATFLTTPMTLLVYPQSYRDKVRNSLKEKEQAELEKRSPSASLPGPLPTGNFENYEDIKFDKLILPIDNLESVSTNLVLLDHLSIPTKLPIHGINIKSLTQRTADLLHASMLKEDNYKSDEHRLNSILSILKIFSDLNTIPFSSEILFSLPEDYLKTMLFNPGFSTNDLLILSVNNREYYANPGILNEFGTLSKLTRFHKCLFINNNQKIQSKHPIEDEILSIHDSAIETESLLSNETILNPKSFSITTLNLILNNTEMASQDLIALKIFSIMVDHKHITVGNIIVQYPNEILNVIQANDSIFKNSKVNISIHKNKDAEIPLKASMGTSKSFIEFVKLNYEAARSNINDLVLVTDNEQRVSFVQELVDNNDKILVVY